MQSGFLNAPVAPRLFFPRALAVSGMMMPHSEFTAFSPFMFVPQGRAYNPRAGIPP
ncbi:MAG TPA: hypothetical protein VMB73_35455 [Acetobacteraceae bacterium]|nr:hypothetical protein [Acetobacteraceae bacterium]